MRRNKFFLLLFVLRESKIRYKLWAISHLFFLCDSCFTFLSFWWKLFNHFVLHLHSQQITDCSRALVKEVNLRLTLFFKLKHYQKSKQSSMKFLVLLKINCLLAGEIKLIVWWLAGRREGKCKQVWKIIFKKIILDTA